MMLLGNINAIPFRRRFGGGGGTPFLSIPGMIARYSASGLTNEQMKENPVWVDKTGNGHDLQMKNFLWGGMSGVGGYKLNWGDSSIWANYITQGALGTGEVTDNTIHITSAKTNNALFETRASLKSVEYKVLIKGLTDDIYLRYGVFNDGKELWTEIKNDGIYTLPSYDYDSKYNMKWKVMSQTYPIDCNITIEQLPLYPGALVFDGVDDYGVCDNFPILTKEKGYTVVALRQWIEEKNSITALVSNSKNWNRDGAFVFEYNNLENNYPNLEISFGSNTNLGREKSSFTYQTSKLYNGKEIKFGEFLGSDKLIVAKANENLSPCSNVAIWELVFLDHDATEEELTKIKDYFVKTYPWLFPNQAWTVTGKTNEDKDRATIANITGNGNDLVLSNFGLAEGSGYGLYAENYSNSRWFINNSITATKKSDTFNVTSINQVAVQIQYIAEPSQSPYTVPSYTIKVTGLTDGQTVNYRVSGGISYPITQDGIYILPGFDFAGMGSWYGFQFNKVQETCDITIEQIPEYEGYLVTDRVDDVIQSKRFLLHRNWTMVGDWRFMPPEKNTNSGIVKSPAIRLYNQLNNIAIYINRTTNPKSISGRSIKTVCSDGRIYLDDWSEFLDTELQTDFDNNAVISIANYGVNFTKMIFKNLSFYDNQLLSKDDCIKAYNYLQTLKAK